MMDFLPLERHNPGQVNPAANMFRLIVFLVSHGLAVAGGFALGIYLLPILTAPDAPSDAEIASAASKGVFSARFVRDLPGSDFLHWGDGELSISARHVSFNGEIAPGPDYRLYLTPRLALDEETFLAMKAESAYVGDVRTFDNFIIDLPGSVDPTAYRALIVWCETFGEFITAAEYR
jgi:hypothetical protein